MEPGVISFGPFMLDAGRGSLTRDGKPVTIGHKAYVLLDALARSPGEVLTKNQLLDVAWPGAEVEESNLSVQIAALRKLLGPAPDGAEWIATVPRVGYRFQPVANTNGETASATTVGTADNMEKPSIAVMPFINMSGDSEQEYLADGIAEDIITALTRCRWFFVAGRNSSFAYKDRPVDAGHMAEELGVRYVLEGSVRRSGKTVRVSAQLVDATIGRDIWAERYDLVSNDFFALQDDIAARVVGAIEPELLKTESAKAARRSGSMTAMDLVWQGAWYFHKITRDDHLRAQQLFRQACDLDPELLEAHIWLGRVNGGIVAYGWADDNEKTIQEGIAASLKAVQIDARNPYAHYALAITNVFAETPRQAIPAAEKAIENNPSFALGYLALGLAYLTCGEAMEAIPPIRRGLELNAHDPQNFVWYNLLAVAHLFADQPVEAQDAANRGAKIRPSWRPVFETLVLCLAALGKLDEAKKMAEHANGMEWPGSDTIGPMKRFNPEWAMRIAETFDEAGLDRQRRATETAEST